MYTIGGVLYHHGIQGQKWGKRNGPPYPLKPSDHSEAEKKASKGRVTGSASEVKKKPTQSGIKDALNNRKKYKKAVKWEKEYMKEFDKRRFSDREFRDVDKEINDLLEKRGLEKPANKMAKKSVNEEEILKTIENKLDKEFKKGKYDSYEEADEYLSKNDKEYRDLHKSLSELNKSKQEPTKNPVQGSTKKLLTDKQRENLKNIIDAFKGDKEEESLVKSAEELLKLDAQRGIKNKRR